MVSFGGLSDITSLSFCDGFVTGFIFVGVKSSQVKSSSI